MPDVPRRSGLADLEESTWLSFIYGGLAVIVMKQKTHGFASPAFAGFAFVGK
jgi:hypothetical protein